MLCLIIPASALPFIAKNGKRVSIASHLPKDKKAIVFFHAFWSNTSSRYLAELDQAVKKNPDLVVLAIDIKNLDSPVAKQYGITTVPSFQIYNAKGELEKEGTPALTEVVNTLK